MNCIEGTQNLAGQIISLLKDFDQSVYDQPLSILEGATLGQHFRHIFDFYQCLITGVDSSLIDYADRQRDLSVEKDPRQALNAFHRIYVSLEALEEEREVTVRADLSDNGSVTRPVLRSSVGRELMFVYDHAVHHLAIIRIGLRSAFPQIVISGNLGVAPSTLKYRKGGSASQ